MSCRVISLVGLLLTPVTATDACGFPGCPENGIVSIIYDSSDSKLAHYECSTMLIDGDVTRQCDADGKWTGDIPRCASEVSSDLRMSVDGHVIKTASFTDKNLETCRWLNTTTSLRFQSNRILELLTLAIVSPGHSKDSLKSSIWTLNVMEKNQVIQRTMERTFQDSGFSSFHVHYSSLQWQLNTHGDTITLMLHQGNVSACEIFIYASPEKCGLPERPINGQSHLNSTHVSYTCEKGFHLSGNQSRSCSYGRWSDDQSVCVSDSISRPSAVPLLVIGLFIGHAAL